MIIYFGSNSGVLDLEKMFIEYAAARLFSYYHAKEIGSDFNKFIGQLNSRQDREIQNDNIFCR